MVLHCLTKYVNGHNNVVMGVLILSYPDINTVRATGKASIPPKCDRRHRLTIRVFLRAERAKTMALWMEMHRLNALTVAHELQSLEDNWERVDGVVYPGLPGRGHTEQSRRKQASVEVA